MVTVEIIKIEKRKLTAYIDGNNVSFTDVIRQLKSGEEIETVIEATNMENNLEESTYKVYINDGNKEVCLNEILE